MFWSSLHRRGGRWINKDPFPHTVTAAGAFDSHPIAAGRSWKYKARRAGEFSYICTLHPTMKGDSGLSDLRTMRIGFRQPACRLLRRSTLSCLVEMQRN